jgi:hypothetical protein
MHASSEMPALQSADPNASSEPGEPEVVSADAEAAYLRSAPAIDALAAEEVRIVNLNVRRSAARILGAMPRLRALEPELRRQLPGFDAAVIGRACDYALSCLYLIAVRRPTRTGAETTRDLAAEARALRTKLRKTAEYMADFGVLEARKVAAIPRQAGNLRTAQDLLALASMLRDTWPALEGRVLLRADDLDRANAVGTELVLGLGARLQPGFRDEDRAEAVNRLARAFTLMVREYGECRRAVTFARWWHGDANDLAPSLFQKGMSGRRRRAKGGS